MDLSSFETLAVSENTGFVSVVLNRPKARNAMSLQMVRELLSLCEWLKSNSAVRGVILRGSEGHFCAGGDIKDMAQARALAMSGTAETDPYYELNRLFGNMMMAVNDLPQVVVAVLEGAVFGGGFGLACVSDIGICHSDAKFGMPETTLGVVPAQIAPFVVERIGLSEARRLSLMAERFGGASALKMGLVHYLEPTGEALAERLNQVCERIRKCAPGANAVTKKILLDVGHVPTAELLDRAAAAFSAAVQGPEGLEGTMAFIEKRKPNWASEA
jgi:isohexenylglutaconyl-CoA hydratase